jgi:hypothetical protein
MNFIFYLCSLFIIFFIIPNSYAGGLELDPGVAKDCSETVILPPATNNAAVDATKIMAAEHRIYSGLYNIGTTQQAVADFTEKTGKNPPIIYTFHDFIGAEDLNSATPKIRTFTEKLEGDDAPSPLDFAEEIAQNGSVLALSWAIECCDFESLDLWYNRIKPNNIVPRLLNGDFDKEIRSAAKQIKNLNQPILLSLFGEFHCLFLANSIRRPGFFLVKMGERKLTILITFATTMAIQHGQMAPSALEILIDA